jgi:4-hydroxybenzoate polyprenyltransferase
VWIAGENHDHEDMKRFLFQYIRSMRLYYGFVTGTTVLFGIWMAHNDGGAWGWREAVALVVGFLAWGVNQIFSDYCDRKEDAVNAPHRPMVTGALAAWPAMVLSAVVMLLFAAVSLLMTPWSLLALCIGGVLNVAYSLLKRVPVLNVMVYACAITCCALYGFAVTSGKFPSPLFVTAIAMMVVPVHALMCHNSYYKDVTGDRAAGVRTLQTLFPENISLIVTVVAAICIILYSLYVVFQWNSFAATVQAAVELTLTAMLLVSLEKRCYHRATCLNCQLCVSMIYAWMLVDRSWPLLPEIASLIIIHLLFLWYRDEKE